MVKRKKIVNVVDLRNDLLEKYVNAETKGEKEDLETFTQAASSIIRSVKVEMDYNKIQDNKRKIDFLEVGEE